ncbi:MAG: bifunctional UDP-N-acetylglucosamine diphosphorylase/glucosamine-1-phosphate N-acetyltransferase GlmU [Gammaproteobacteria bacterium]
MNIKTVILAAGQGTRMRSEKPKILHRIADKPLLKHVYDMSARIPGNSICIVYGHGAEQVRDELSSLDAVWVEQKERLGTGHAVQQAVGHIGDRDTVLILYGDVPLLKLETVETLLALVGENSMGLLTVDLVNPAGYGRIVRDGANKVVKIVEEKDASDEIKAVTEVNTGILAVAGGRLKNWLGRLGNDNAQGEYYLTDVIEMASGGGVEVRTAHPRRMTEVMGINDRKQLSHLERVYQMEQADKLMAEGVTLRDHARFDLRGEIETIGRDVEIDVNVVLEGKLRIGSNVRIGPNTVIVNSEIADDVEILANCVIENARIGAGSRIGPFARIRPETVLAEQVHVGNFVEIKKSSVDRGSKINHLSYVGDAVVGSGVNIGAGTITCNYDGANKFQTFIGDGAFIGSDTQLVAPVTVGKNATIGAGSTITRDTPEDRLTLSRSKQLTIEGWQRPVKKEK